MYFLMVGGAGDAFFKGRRGREGITRRSPTSRYYPLAPPTIREYPIAYYYSITLQAIQSPSLSSHEEMHSRHKKAPQLAWFSVSA